MEIEISLNFFIFSTMNFWNVIFLLTYLLFCNAFQYFSNFFSHFNGTKYLFHFKFLNSLIHFIYVLFFIFSCISLFIFS